MHASFDPPPKGSDFDSGEALAQDDADETVSRTEGSLKFAERRECGRTFARVILSGAKRNRTAKQCEANAEQDLGRRWGNACAIMSIY